MKFLIPLTQVNQKSNLQVWYFELSGVPGIKIVLPRTTTNADSIELPSFYKATVLTKHKNSPTMEHLIPVRKADSVITIEITPNATNDMLFLFLSFERIPTFRSFLYSTQVSSLPKDPIYGFHQWFVDSYQVQNRTGRWFLAVIQLNEILSEEETTSFDKSKISEFRTDYSLRTYTTGCYFLEEKYEEWTARGTIVLSTTYEETICLTSHLTMFGSGFFVQPNINDFQYILAHADFKDNLTVYITVLVVIIVYLLSLIWAGMQDMWDIQRAAALPLPDNNPAHSYLYEIVVYTGLQPMSTCKSRINMIVQGDIMDTEIRSFPKERFLSLKNSYSNTLYVQITFNRGGIDSFIMTSSR